MINNDKPLSQSDLQGPARDFSDFCDAEFERRRNADSPFDEIAYIEAKELVLKKLIGPAEAL